MASHDSLTALFEPQSVAVIGASEDRLRIGGRPLDYLLRAGYAGAIYPINPNRASVQGLPAYKDIADVSGPVDLAIVAVAAAQAPAAVQACADKGVRAVILFSSGFAETGQEGAAVQASLRQIAQRSGMRLLGPNCLGVFNARSGFFGTFTAALNQALAKPGPIAIASQSGACGGHLAYLCAQRGLGINYWITTGNEADVQLAECLLWLAQAEEVKVILAYAEAVRDGETFVRALDLARRNGKPVILLKVGRSKAGARAAASHTGALAGEDVVYDAVLRQFGAWRATSIEQALDIAYACVAGIFPASPRIGLITGSGGIGVQMADAAERVGLDVAPMPESTQGQLKELIPFIGAANPVDVTAQVVNDMSLMARCIELTLAEGKYDSILVFLSSGPSIPTVAASLLTMFAPLRGKYPERLIVLSMAAPPDTVQAFERIGFPVFEDTDRALTAIAALTQFGDSFRRQPAALKLGAVSAAQELLPRQLDEHVAKRILGAAGIPSWPETLAADPAAVRAAAEAFGVPVAIKIASPDILHKTEVGGVALGVADPAQAQEIATEMLLRVGREKPLARITGLLVSPMAQGGVETICGSLRDPVFGPVVMFGLGGIFVEVLRDVAFRRAPFDEAEAMRMIDEIRGRAVLNGVRGQPAADVGALARVLARLSVFAYERRGEVSEIDINPLLARPDGVFALDALITVA
ncbi:MAG: acetate--CoA ligase family protein [Sulfuricaulis sp.]|nr:acetate--CoA ligase family protein [Sulfuricaulis sp.]